MAATKQTHRFIPSDLTVLDRNSRKNMLPSVIYWVACVEGVGIAALCHPDMLGGRAVYVQFYS